MPELKDKLIHAYDEMMEHLHALIEQADEGSANLQKLLLKARDHLVESEKATPEEADKVHNFLQRDLHNASDYLSDTGNDLAAWLHMDVTLIEWKLMDMFLAVADKTKLDLLLLEENAKHVNEYHTGEITGPGLLVCDACGEVLHYKKTGHIPPCPKCHATQYTRKSK